MRRLKFTAVSLLLFTAFQANAVELKNRMPANGQGRVIWLVNAEMDFPVDCTITWTDVDKQGRRNPGGRSQLFDVGGNQWNEALGPMLDYGIIRFEDSYAYCEKSSAQRERERIAAMNEAAERKRKEEQVRLEQQKRDQEAARQRAETQRQQEQERQEAERQRAEAQRRQDANNRQSTNAAAEQAKLDAKAAAEAQQRRFAEAERARQDALRQQQLLQQQQAAQAAQAAEQARQAAERNRVAQLNNSNANMLAAYSALSAMADSVERNNIQQRERNRQLQKAQEERQRQEQAAKQQREEIELAGAKLMLEKARANMKNNPWGNQ